ncbi:hypothetical protein PFISCL1PPCAC_5343, partial [Pristionchus fissidentatus]
STIGTPSARTIETNDTAREVNGDPIKEQERVSYENMLIRYGDWSRIRGQVFVYIALVVIGLLYRVHSEQSTFWESSKL